MQARMKHPAFLVPGVMDALLALSKATGAVLPLVTRHLVQLRASQLNGCSQCVDMHAKDMKKSGETDERIFAVGAWRHAPYFTDAERAALALTEALTRLADEPDPVPDSLWAEVSRHFEENALAALIVCIANINVWNRLNAAVGQVAGTVGTRLS
jgi:AhpD family alkylhydroperoxidase